MSPLFRKILGINWVVAITMTGLMIFGIFAIYSAAYGDPAVEDQEFWRRQIKWIIVGTPIFLITSLVDYRWIRYLALPAYLGAMGLLLALPFIGKTLNGATSWIMIGSNSIQPSQIALISGVLVLSVTLGELHRLHPVFRNHMLRMAISLGLVAIPMALVLKEPDMGSASVWGPMTAFMLLVANIPFRYLTVLTLLALIAMPLVYWFGLKPHQKPRIQVLIQALKGEELDTRGDAFSSVRLMMAIGSAGWEGKGHKGSRIKAKNPDAKTMSELGLVDSEPDLSDFIFGTIGEEHGFRGSMIMITAFLLLLLQCLYIGFYSRDQTGRLLVTGAVSILFWHVFMNIGMCIQIVPITGVPLPFVSYGGTFVVTCMFLMGLVESVWIHRNEEIGSEKSIFY
ncbi:rod shape-determining protein RodA [bacterium]|nr:rod shape-determining protein RodA [bacterium]MDB4467745.1 rod shape-determining protein RodA [Verrucomicrobiales bacterium]MDF1785545.1 FtsW/RodA/SpoVE family cell cycle protein [Verrucomicrobiales bacterium]